MTGSQLLKLSLRLDIYVCVILKRICFFFAIILFIFLLALFITELTPAILINYCLENSEID